MARTFRWLWILCVALLAAPAARAGDATGTPLVTAQWLLENRERSDLLLLDASPPPQHAKQHIPGAVGASVMSYGAQEIPAAALEAKFRSWGVSPGRKTVVYDNGDALWAARLFFDLYRHGFPLENLALLDGGLPQWKAIGGPVTGEPTPAVPPGSMRIARADDTVRARLPEVLAATGDPAGHALVEALDAGWHFGGTVFFDRPGHIPHAILAPPADFLRPDGTFKSAQELRPMLAYLGIGPQQEVLTFCGGGIAAAVPFFALKFVAGYPRVRLFVESELGWLRDERGLPYWTYDAPYLMREAAWLKAWGSRMMRLYGVANVTVVDVRPADAFAFGHVPFALNVPAETFRRHLDAPAALAEALRLAGVDPAQEVVVDSGKGLDRDSALAYLMLVRAGLARVSVLVDSHGKAVAAGLAVGPEDKDAKAKLPPRAPSATWPAPPAAAERVLVAGPPEASGGFPRVFVAAGQRLPAAPPAGKVVHVPSADLVDGDGAPLPAKAIWARLAKAGVPRYAELVVLADDPGEAAVDYYVLKLMGFPDVKVLLGAGAATGG
jgi:thiosulfate/3-mercaptopyruvate sulfurtransferase